jgi:hypothetical protein
VYLRASEKTKVVTMLFGVFFSKTIAIQNNGWDLNHIEGRAFGVEQYCVKEN